MFTYLKFESREDKNVGISYKIQIVMPLKLHAVVMNAVIEYMCGHMLVFQQPYKYSDLQRQ
jgi:hypothetical protein